VGGGGRISYVFRNVEVFKKDSCFMELVNQPTVDDVMKIYVVALPLMD
jgi:hypothetical protein